MNSSRDDHKPNLDQLSKLVDPADQSAVRKAVFNTLEMTGLSKSGLAEFRKIYDDITDLYSGKYQGYRACDTEYHDFRHTTDVLLATVRLVDGVKLSGEDISDVGVFCVAVAALMHDTGYIPENDDPIETGAAYTEDHVERGIDFLKKYLTKRGYGSDTTEKIAQIVVTTELKCDLKEIDFITDETRRLAILLGAADLLGQMADRIYLEKLLFLYKEFKAGNISGFISEEDMLFKTVEFYRQMKERLATDLEGVDRLMIYHFRERYSIDSNLYHMGMENNIRYLHFILDNHAGSHRDFLRRDGLISKL